MTPQEEQPFPTHSFTIGEPDWYCPECGQAREVCGAKEVTLSMGQNGEPPERIVECRYANSPGDAFADEWREERRADDKRDRWQQMEDSISF
jgi:hypothetical protein